MQGKREDLMMHAMHYVYVAPSKCAAFDADLIRLKERGIRVRALTPKGDTMPVRRMVQVMAENTCLGLIVPDDERRNTRIVQHVQTCATLMRMDVLRVTDHTETKPAAASAVPATQHPAVAGKTTPMP